METVTDFIFLGSKITADSDCRHEIKRHLLLERKAMTNLHHILKSRDISLPTKVHLVKAMVFPVVMYGCESWTIKKSWVPKNWCFWTIEGIEENCWESLALQGDPTSPSERKSVLKFIERTDAEAEAPILWPPDVKNWFLKKDPDTGKDWRQEEKAMTEDEMIGWHHRFDGHEFEQALGVGDGQGSLACCNPWGCRVRHDWVTELNQLFHWLQ